MGNMKVKMPNSFSATLSALGADYDDIVKEALLRGIEPLRAQAQSNLNSVVGRSTKHPSQSTGETQTKLGVSKPSLKGDTWDVKLGIAAGYGSNGVAYRLKASVLEHGRSGQAPKPWLAPAVKTKKKECIAEAQAYIDKVVSSK